MQIVTMKQDNLSTDPITSGVNMCFIPSAAPSNIIERMKKMINTT